MTSEDVPSALALVNKYSSQFEIRQVFTSEEEFSHYFLCPNCFSYVVENEANDITDLVTVHSNLVQASVTIVVSTHSPIKQLIMDAMVCARDYGTKQFTIEQKHNITNNILLSLSLHPGSTADYYFYNYRYHEIPGSKLYTVF